MNKTAIITPYFKETRALLERCIGSVKGQSLPCDHFLVADGFAQAWIDGEKVRHVKLDRPHADYGNTPRGLGALLAISEEYDAIGFMDADNWLEPDHVQLCLDAARHVADCDYVVASRFFRRQDESIMPLREEDDHVDTNCFFFLRGSFAYIIHFALMPREVSVLCDRVFYSMLSRKQLNVARTSKPSVNYHSIWASFYRAIGEEPPPGAKPDISLPADFAAGKSQREIEIANRLAGYELFPDRKS